MTTFLKELGDFLIDDILNMLYGYYLDIGTTIKINSITYTVLGTFSIKIGSEFRHENIIICLNGGHILTIGVDSPYVFTKKDDNGNFNNTVVSPKNIEL